jgi:RNA polymerase sigma-70 factor (ECF subfamily)
LKPVTVQAELVERAKRGDRAAFAELHARYGKMVHAVLLARLPVADAEEQVQEVFLIAWKNLRQLEDGAVFGGWLSAIARNRAIDFYRRRREVATLHLGPSDTRSLSSADRVQAKEVLRAIQSLPDTYHETLLMRLCEGLTGPEIAELTGLEPGSVRVNLHRGMKLLREKLGLQRRKAAHE